MNSSPSGKNIPPPGQQPGPTLLDATTRINNCANAGEKTLFQLNRAQTQTPIGKPEFIPARKQVQCCIASLQALLESHVDLRAVISQNGGTLSCRLFIEYLIKITNNIDNLSPINYLLLKGGVHIDIRTKPLKFVRFEVDSEGWSNISPLAISKQFDLDTPVLDIENYKLIDPRYKMPWLREFYQTLDSELAEFIVGYFKLSSLKFTSIKQLLNIADEDDLRLDFYRDLIINSENFGSTIGSWLSKRSLDIPFIQSCFNSNEFSITANNTIIMNILSHDLSLFDFEYKELVMHLNKYYTSPLNEQNKLLSMNDLVCLIEKCLGRSLSGIRIKRQNNKMALKVKTFSQIVDFYNGAKDEEQVITEQIKGQPDMVKPVKKTKTKATISKAKIVKPKKQVNPLIKVEKKGPLVNDVISNTILKLKEQLLKSKPKGKDENCSIITDKPVKDEDYSCVLKTMGFNTVLAVASITYKQLHFIEFPPSTSKEGVNLTPSSFSKIALSLSSLSFKSSRWKLCSKLEKISNNDEHLSLIIKKTKENVFNIRSFSKCAFNLFRLDNDDSDMSALGFYNSSLMHLGSNEQFHKIENALSKDFEFIKSKSQNDSMYLNLNVIQNDQFISASISDYIIKITNDLQLFNEQEILFIHAHTESLYHPEFKVLQLPPNDDIHSLNRDFISALRILPFKQNFTTEQYKLLIKILNFIVEKGRWDISFAVQLLERYIELPNQLCYESIIQTFRYLFSTLNAKLIFTKRRIFNRFPNIEVFTDASFSVNKSAYYGFILLLNGRYIASKSARIRMKVSNIMEAELVGIHYGAKAALAFQQGLVGGFQNNSDSSESVCGNIPITVVNDNLGLIESLRANRISNISTDLFDLAGTVSGYFAQGLADIRHIRGCENPADILTKTLPTKAFQEALDFYIVSSFFKKR